MIVKKILSILLWKAISLAPLCGSVLDIHGFMVTPNAMLKLERTLLKAGLNVFPYKYDARNETIECHAIRLKERLKKMACSSPQEPINFVCHSIGGVVLRAALSLPDCPEEAKVGRAVLLAPPNQGSFLARKFRNVLPLRWVLGTKSGWELMYYTPSDMERLGQFPCTMQVLVIAGARGTRIAFQGRLNDCYLAVEETRLNTPHALIVLDVTHGGLLTSDLSLRITRDFLLCGKAP